MANVFYLFHALTCNSRAVVGDDVKSKFRLQMVIIDACRLIDCILLPSTDVNIQRCQNQRRHNDGSLYETLAQRFSTGTMLMMMEHRCVVLVLLAEVEYTEVRWSWCAGWTDRLCCLGKSCGLIDRANVALSFSNK